MRGRLTSLLLTAFVHRLNITASRLPVRSVQTHKQFWFFCYKSFGSYSLQDQIPDKRQLSIFPFSISRITWNFPSTLKPVLLFVTAAVGQYRAPVRTEWIAVGIFALPGCYAA